MRMIVLYTEKVKARCIHRALTFVQSWTFDQTPE